MKARMTDEKIEYLIELAGSIASAQADVARLRLELRGALADAGMGFLNTPAAKPVKRRKRRMARGMAKHNERIEAITAQADTLSQRIIRAVAKNGPIDRIGIAAIVEKNPARVSNELTQLVKTGAVQRTANGYVAANGSVARA